MFVSSSTHIPIHPLFIDFSEMVPWYSCRESRGFGFVQYMDPADAADAQYNMDRQVVGGREITVVFAEENRKKPSEMRIKERSR